MITSDMASLYTLILWKVARFLAGVGITVAAGSWGLTNARRRRAQGITWESMQSEVRLTPMSVVRIVIAALFAVFFFWSPLNYEFLSKIAGYLQQFGLVLLRSLLAYLFIFQWIMIEDRTRLRRAGWMVGVSMLIMSAVEIFTLAPMALSMTPDGGEIYKNVIVKQTTGFSCAPSTLATVCRLYGRPVTEFDAAIAIGAGYGGSFDLEIERGAVALGFQEARFWHTTLDAIASDDLPLQLSIKYLDVWDLHSVAMIGLSSTTVFLGDPIEGLRRIPRTKFGEIWRGRAVRLGVPTFASGTTVLLSTFDPDRFKRSRSAR
ncbi:MAG: hypothetical protein HQM09_02150 [Candidatus Riflebacteria bacterium]|nr:hypothetical protein [Candidatus Riflebacteria bacterium]